MGIGAATDGPPLPLDLQLWGVVEMRIGAVLTTILDHPWFVPAALAVWVLLRLALMFLVPVAPVSDALWYHDSAVSIAQGLGYNRNGAPTAFWPVGYPAFLATFYWLLGANPGVGQAANLLLSVLTFFLVLAIGREVSGSERGARLAVLLLAFYPNYIAYPSLLFSETLFTTLLLTIVWLYLRQTRWVMIVVIGVLCGAATLVKAQALLLAPLLVIFNTVVIARGRARLAVLARGALLCLVMLATLMPWSYRNFQAIHAPVLVSTNGGITMLTGNNPSMRPDYRTDFHLDDPLVVSLGHPAGDEVEIDHRAQRLALEWMRGNPAQFLALIPHKVFRLWAPDGEAVWSYQKMGTAYDTHRWAYRAVRVINQAYYVLMLLAALAFPLLYRRRAAGRGSAWIWFCYFFSLYITLVSIVFSGQSRFHFPVMALLVINAAWSLRLVMRGRDFVS
jgi:4-amino-4-deoxy-L-arabinose transferase-like glycosyltransferase